MDYAVAHELAHAKQAETYGFIGVGALPRWLIEERADEEAGKLIGKSDEEVCSIVSQLNKKLIEKRKKA